jgi:hypothetical protein
MLNLNRRNFQAHPFHLVSPSPWPLYTSLSILTLTTSAVLSFHGFAYAEYNLILGLTALILSMSFWWRDVIAEGTYIGHHTLAVQRGINIGVGLCLVKRRAVLLAKNNLWVFLSDNFCDNYRVTPHKFATKLLKSDLAISEIVSQIDSLLPQLASFINQFNTTVSQSEISVITDTIGNMSIDVPQHISEELANKLTNKIGVIDRLITTRSQDISDLIKQGTILEEKLKLADSHYVSQLSDRMQEYKRLISSYKHS